MEDKLNSRKFRKSFTYLYFSSEIEIDGPRLQNILAGAGVAKGDLLMKNDCLKSTAFKSGFLKIRKDAAPPLLKLLSTMKFAEISRPSFDQIKRQLSTNNTFNGIPQNSDLADICPLPGLQASEMKRNGQFPCEITIRNSSLVWPVGNSWQEDGRTSSSVQFLPQSGKTRQPNSWHAHFNDRYTPIVRQPEAPIRLVNKKPKLDFSRPNIDNPKKQHAFGDYYIRPYLRVSDKIISNARDLSNIRINILKPSKSHRLNQNKTSNLPLLIQTSSSLLAAEDIPS